MSDGGAVLEAGAAPDVGAAGMTGGVKGGGLRRTQCGGSGVDTCVGMRMRPGRFLLILFESSLKEVVCVKHGLIATPQPVLSEGERRRGRGGDTLSQPQFYMTIKKPVGGRHLGGCVLRPSNSRSRRFAPLCYLLSFSVSYDQASP